MVAGARARIIGLSQIRRDQRRGSGTQFLLRAVASDCRSGVRD